MARCRSIRQLRYSYPLASRHRRKRVLTKEEVRRALSILDVRERLVFRMAVFNGMRPGEIFAIQIGKVAPNSVGR